MQRMKKYALRFKEIQGQASKNLPTKTNDLSLEETAKLVKERDQKLGRLISTMSSNYPLLQVMGYNQINQNSQAEIEPTDMTIFYL